MFLTLPFALVGGVLAAWATGGVLSIGSLVGFFTVFGIAARNGILLINHAQHLEREEGETFGVDLVIRAARERLAPILMTSLATGLALVPLVVLGDRPGHEIEHPLAVVILGGLLTSTLLNLFVTPLLYLRFGRTRGDAPRSRAAQFPPRSRSERPPERAAPGHGRKDQDVSQEQSPPGPGGRGGPLLTLAPAGVATAAVGSGGLPCPQRVPFHPDRFHEATEIDNEFLPMVPGTRHVYTGTTSAGAHQIVSTVTDLTKVVDGVKARVVHEVDIQDGQVAESELTLFAQDDAGNVWNLAEYPEDLQRQRAIHRSPGHLGGRPAEHQGRDPHAGGSRAADVRNKLYLQGSSPSIDFLDCARVRFVDRTTNVPVGRFHDVLTTWETSPLEGTPPSRPRRTRRTSGSSG